MTHKQHSIFQKSSLRGMVYFAIFFTRIQEALTGKAVGQWHPATKR